jgi:hypothetical protein
MLNRPFLELSRVFLLRDLFHLLPPKSNVNCTSPLEDYLSGEPQFVIRPTHRLPDSGKTLVFLTNITTSPILTITALYKSRWQVELFFKWMMQHLPIKRFIEGSSIDDALIASA